MTCDLLTSPERSRIIAHMNTRHTLRAVALLLVAAGVAGCNFSQRNDNVVVVTATPSHLLVTPTDEPTIPYVTPTPHFEPTPTLPRRRPSRTPSWRCTTATT